MNHIPEHENLERELAYARTARRLAQKLWDAGCDPKTMDDMRRDLKSVAGWYFDLCDQFVMRVDNAMHEICKETFPNAPAGFLTDRPDKRNDYDPKRKG